MIDLAPYRADKNALVAEIERATVKCKKNKTKWLCPFHNENSGSFGIVEHEGAWHFKCFGCGKSGDVFDMQALNDKRPVEDIIAALNPKTPPKPKEELVIYETLEKLIAAVKYKYCVNGTAYEAEYIYRTPGTENIDLVVFRMKSAEKKFFIQATQKDGGFALKNFLPRNPVYNRTRLSRSNGIVVIVEGEKKVHCLTGLGFVATCSPGGANAAEKADWTPLAGKNLIIWPDNDSSGSKYSEAVQAELRKLKPRPTVRTVNLEPLSLEAKDDVVDFVARYNDIPSQRAAVQTVLDSARVTGAIADLDAEVQDALDGKRYPIKFPWPILSEATYALTPGGTMMLCGMPGGRKSLMILQLFRHMVTEGVPTCLYALEDGVAYQLRRLWAQICGERHLTNDVWCRNNPELVKEAMAFAREQLLMLEKNIEPRTTRDDLKPAKLVEWVKKQCDDGKRVIIIDPITKMTKGKLGYLDDDEFLDGAQAAIQKSKASIILVTHPSKSARKGFELSMDDLAGGASYRNFGQCIVYLKAQAEEAATIETMHGVTSAVIDNVLAIFKARNSDGFGKRIGFKFHKESLTLSEQGIIQD